LLAELNQRLLGLSTPHESRNRESVPKTHDSHQRRTGDTRIDKWLSLYASKNPEIRIRAATALIRHDDAPLSILLDILDTLSHHGLGAATERALFNHNESDLVTAMIGRLDSNDQFIREVACNVLGNSANYSVTPHLLRMIDDPHLMVRRAAGFALSRLKDSSAIPELKRQFAARRNDDINVVWALQTALESLGVDTESAR